MILRGSVLCLALISFVNCLTREETVHFKNSRSHGGEVSVEEHGSNFVITANGLPDHATQRVNPNTATAHTMKYTFPKKPTMASTHGCLHGGTIGMTRTGVAIYDPLDADGENAVEGSGAERFDSCDGHADNHGIYHYHKIPDSCLYKGEVDEFIGVALDGFPIYGPRVSDLQGDITNKHLDECHGRMFNGSYRYHVNNEFPYFLGCYKGEVPTSNTRTNYDCTSQSAYSDTWGYVCTCGTPGSHGSHQQPNGQHQQPPNQFNMQNHTPPPDGHHPTGTHHPRPTGTHHPRPTGTHPPAPTGPHGHRLPPPDGLHHPHRPWRPNQDIFGKK